MANIKVKRSAVPGKVPLVGDLALGEFAVNTHDGKVYTKKNVDGTETIVTVNPDGVALQNLQNRYSYTVSGSAQGTFAASYVVPYVDVYQNGSRLATGDYTATDGSSVVLAVAAQPGDVVEIVALNSYTANSDFLNVPGGIATADFVKFDVAATNTPEVAKLNWNDDDGTLEFGLKGGQVVLQVGQEQVQRIYNNTGSTLVSGQVVYVTGSQGNRLTVALASASSESTSTRTFGVVTETILNEAEGFITTSGLVRKLDTSAFAEGSVLWLGTTAGTYTTTRPTAPNHGVLVGFVVRQHASVGSVFVHVANGYELDELHNVLITSKQDGQALVYETSSGLWKNKFVDYNTLLNKPTLVTQTDINNAVATKQDTLVSGTNIKTVNGTSILGSGNIQIDGGVVSFNTRTGAITLSSSDVTTALGYIPATSGDISSAISALVDTAPTTLDTLNELAAALGDDPNFATTVTNLVAAKQDTLVSGTNIKTVNGTSILGSGNIQIDGGVTSFNTRTGAVTLSSSDVTSALGYTPYDSSNPTGYLTGADIDQYTIIGALGYTPLSDAVSYLPLAGGTMTGAITFAAAQTWPTFNQSTTGNAATATALQTARTINGVSFDGTANITVADSTKLPLAGGTMTGVITTVSSGTAINFSGQTDSFGYNSTAGLGTYIKGTGATYIYGGGSFFDGSNHRTLLHAGNYNTYAPTLTGTGASGTWGISISGNAATASTATTATNQSGGTINATTGTVTPNTTGVSTGFTVVNGDITTYRSGGTTGVIYLSNSGTRYLYWDGTNYIMPGGQLDVNGQRVLNAGNYNSYAPTLTGGGASGTWGINITGNSATTSQTTFSELYTNNWFRNNTTNTGLYNQVTTQHWSSRDNGYWDASSTNSVSAIRFYTGGHVSALRGAVYANTSNEIGFLTYALGWSWRMDGSGNGTATGNVTAYSDERLKKDWTPLTENFVERMASEVKYGTYTRTDIDQRQAGVSAQDWQKLLPETVMVDREGTLSLAYGNAALVSTIELAKRVVDQDARIAKLEALITKLTGA